MSQTSINRVTLVGHLTADPELHSLPSGDNVCQMRLACNGRRRNSEGGYETRPNYFSVRVFGPQSENVHRYLRKGRAVAIDGRLEWREWETPDQQKRQTVAIIAHEVQFLSNSPQRSGAEGLEGEELTSDGLGVEDMELVTSASISDEDFDSVELSGEEDLAEHVELQGKPDLVGASVAGDSDDLLF
jgi:single-strand DNA-binding protein